MDRQSLETGSESDPNDLASLVSEMADDKCRDCEKLRAWIEQVRNAVHCLRNTGSVSLSAFSSQIDLIHHRHKAGGVWGKKKTGGMDRQSPEAAPLGAPSSSSA